MQQIIIYKRINSLRKNTFYYSNILALSNFYDFELVKYFVIEFKDISINYLFKY